MSLWRALLIGLGAGALALGFAAGFVLFTETVWWP
jgi:hypothetical protein